MGATVSRRLAPKGGASALTVCVSSAGQKHSSLDLHPEPQPGSGMQSVNGEQVTVPSPGQSLRRPRRG